jgi:hypothetical protein
VALAALLAPCVPVAQNVAQILEKTTDPATGQTFPEAADFQIVWVVIGEVASADGSGSVFAGRQLFLASDLMSRTLHNVKVERVVALPSILNVSIGQRLCLRSLRVVATDPQKKQIDAAPLSVEIRQDHKERLGLQRSRSNICVSPSAVGEYPLRLTSLLPARDGTMRGAQIFIRAKVAKAVTAIDNN